MESYHQRGSQSTEIRPSQFAPRPYFTTSFRTQNVIFSDLIPNFSISYARTGVSYPHSLNPYPHTCPQHTGGELDGDGVAVPDHGGGLAFAFIVR